MADHSVVEGNAGAEVGGAADVAKGAVPAGDGALAMTSRALAILLVYSVFWLVVPLVVLMGLYPDPGAPLPRAIRFALLIGLSSGAIHGVASLAAHAGRRDLATAWTTFYVCRPFLGAGMAVVTTLLLVSGVVGTPPKDNDALLLSWGALAGLYSQPALEKLKELFATLFATRQGRGANGGSQIAHRGD